VALGGDSLDSLSDRTRARRLAFVPSRFPSGVRLTAFEFAALGRSPYLNLWGRLSKSDREVVERSLASVDASQFSAHSVASLSDGERQKISLARALAQEPRALLMDEPTAFLDAINRYRLHETLLRLAASQQTAILLSSHDLSLSLKFAHQILLLDGKGNWDAGTVEELTANGRLKEVFGEAL
jgi:iron complex transport system ATP-binding protein